MDKAQKLIESEVLKPMPLPAMNKWTKVAPTVAHIALLGLFHNGFVVDAFKAEFGELQDEESDLSNNEDDKLGVPANEARKWRLLARRRNMRATNFLAEAQSLWINLLWCRLASSTMILHAMLFKNATWFTDRSPQELSRARHLFATFCDPDTNPAWANLQELLGILTHPEPFLALLVWKFGPVAQWPQPRRRIVRKAVMVMTGQLARKLILPWQQYPWRLWPLALKDVDDAKRKECAQDLLRSPPCCLDSGFSKRLKHLHPRESELLSSDVQTFLATVFARIAPTSTFIERRFAQFTNWSEKKPKFSALAAKHVTSFCKGAAQAWRNKNPNHKKPNHRQRPAWAKDTAKRTTGYNMFLSEFRKSMQGRSFRGDDGRSDFVQEASAAWQRLSQGEKASYGMRARGMNSLRQRSTCSLEEEELSTDDSGGLWGMCRLNEAWPISVCILQAALGEGRTALNNISAEWEQACVSSRVSKATIWLFAKIS